MQRESRIPEIVLIAAVGAPQDIPGGGSFDGKIGSVSRRREGRCHESSRQQDKGRRGVEGESASASAACTHLLDMEDGTLAATKQKMAWAKDSEIIVQHNGAPAHASAEIQCLLACAGCRDGWDMAFETQPAQPPDLDRPHLCLCNSMQQRSHQLMSERGRGKEGIIAAVQRMWEECTAEKLTAAKPITVIATHIASRRVGHKQSAQRRVRVGSSTSCCPAVKAPRLALKGPEKQEGEGRPSAPLAICCSHCRTHSLRTWFAK